MLVRVQFLLLVQRLFFSQVSSDQQSLIYYGQAKRDLPDVPPPLHDLYEVNKDFSSHGKSVATLKVLTDTTI